MLSSHTAHFFYPLYSVYNMIRFALLSSLLIGCGAFLHSPPADEKMTLRILDNEDEQAEDEEADYSWMEGYTLKYENCFADDNLASFLLCPSNATCSSGCDGGAKYTADFAFFIDAFTEAQLGAREYACEMARENCDNDDEDTCYSNAGLDYCVDKEDDEFDVQEYLECAQFQDGYIGPYCADGYNIYLGYYEDECYTLADEGAFESEYGYALPYSAESIIEGDCARCNEHGLDQDQTEGDQDDDDDVLEQCVELYEGVYSKCEDGMGGDTTGCDSIDTLEENDPAVASIKNGSSGGSIAMTVVLFIALATAILACCGLAFYCYPKLMNQKEDDPTEPTTTGPGYNIM